VSSAHPDKSRTFGFLGKNPMFSCKDIFVDVQKTLPIKGMKPIQHTSNFFEMGILLCLRLVLFLSSDALRLTLHEVSSFLVPARPG